MRMKRRQLAEEEAHKAPVKDAHSHGIINIPFLVNRAFNTSRHTYHAFRPWDDVWPISEFGGKWKN